MKKQIGIMGVKEDIANLSSYEKAKQKAVELGKITLPSPFTIGDIEVTVIKQPKEKNSLLEVEVSARRISTNTTLTVNNPLHYYNPPILIPTENGFEENLEESLKLIIVDTIRIINR